MSQQIDENTQADTRKRLIPCMLIVMDIIRIIVLIHYGTSGSTGDIASILEDPDLVLSITGQVTNMIHRLQKHLDHKKDRNQES